MQKDLIELQKLRKSKTLVYMTSDRPNLPMQIEEDIIEVFHEHLEALGAQDNLDLFIYSRGGATIVPLPLVRLIRKYCKKFSAIVPFRAHSAATMICVGADEIYMSRKAELGPIDPQLTINSPQGQRVIASTDLFAYLDFAKTELGWQNSNTDASVEILEFLHKYCSLSPDIIGKIYRMFTQSKKYIQELADSHADGYRLEREKVDFLAETLMRGFGSHDYKIDSEEAKAKLGLNILPFDKDVETKVDSLYSKLFKTLQLGMPFLPSTIGNTGKDTVSLILSENKLSVKTLDYKVCQGNDGKPAIDGTFSQWAPAV